MRDRRHSQHHDGPTADRRGSFADPGGVNEDAYGFWNDEPTRSLRSLIPARQSGQRRSRRHNDTAPIEHVDADPTPIAAYDPWLDDDLSTASFGAHEPTTGSYRYGTMAGSAGTRGTGGWDVADDVYDDDFEVDAATPLATVSAARSTAIDPLLKRVGLMVGAMALLVPIGMAARGSDKPSSSLTSPPSSIEPSPATGPSAVPISADGSSSASSSSDAYGARALAITIAPPSSQPSPSSDPSTIASTSGSAAAAATTGAGAASRPAAAKTVAANPICGYSSYKVAAGDFWVSIASAANVRLADLLTINNATKQTALYPGDTICMPPKAASPSTAPTPATAAASTAAASTAAPATAAPTTAARTTAPPTTKPATTTPATTKPTTTATPTTAKPATTAVPTTKPPTTSTPAGTAPPNRYTRDQVIQIIREVWPDELEDEAIRIATRESNLIPTVRNFCCFGLFQVYYSVHKGWLSAMGVTSAEMLYDPRVNARAAYALYQRAGGWGPWKL